MKWYQYLVDALEIPTLKHALEDSAKRYKMRFEDYAPGDCVRMAEFLYMLPNSLETHQMLGTYIKKYKMPQEV